MHSLPALVVGLAGLAAALPSSVARQSQPWQPSQGESFDYTIRGALDNATPSAKVVGIDLFDNNASTISDLQHNGARVICYFSAGSYEDWRPDWKANASEIGKPLKGWKGEWWADIRLDSVRAVMAKRIELALTKGCDAVDPDNIDGYNNDNGLNLTQADSVDYVQFMSTEAHNRGLGIGLKNSLEIVDTLTTTVDFCVNEQCHQYKECDTYKAFVAAGKNVFHIEYPKGLKSSNDKPAKASKKKSICEDPDVQLGFTTIMKNINLDKWLETCDT